MDNNGIQLLSLFANATPTNEPDMLQFVWLLSNSLLLGIFLTFLTYLFTLPAVKKESMGQKKKLLLKIDTFVASSNILFLCVGLTGVMVLVNNNIARAVAIAATLTLVRFRVTLGNKLIGSNMLFGIIAGIACGLDELAVAWSMTLVYIVMQVILFSVIHNYQSQITQLDNRPKEKKKNSNKANSPVSADVYSMTPMDVKFNGHHSVNPTSGY